MAIKNIIAKNFRCFLTRISPKLNTKAIYLAKTHKRLNLKNPTTLNEKILWLKFNTYLNSPLVKECADKYKVRKYIEDCGYGDNLNVLLDAFKNPEDIKWDELPNSFVIKLNIGCGFNHIIYNKEEVSRENIVNELYTWLKKAPNYYLGYSEMHYKDVDPYIIIEKYMGGPNRELPDDYKFYCINGKCELIMFCKDRDDHGHGAKFYYMDRNWNMVANAQNLTAIPVEKPTMLNQAVDMAETLCKPFPFVRVDLYLFENNIVFGELTFTPAAGVDVDHLLKPLGSDIDLDHIYGEKLVLS